MKEHSYTEILASRLYRGTPGIVARPEKRAAELEGPESAVLIGGRYALGARIGRGRLGEIYAAADRASTDLGIERTVALQLVDEAVAPGSSRAAELTRCCAALRAGPHPNIVEILDCGRDSKRFYVVMELLQGLSLRAILDDASRETLSEDDEVLPIVSAVAEAVRYLHAKEMVYGGLKPEQIFVTVDYAVKVLDLPLTHLRQATPFYVENEEDPEPDEADDVYGLACLTYELLSGRHPFNENSPLDAYRAEMTPTPLEHLRAGRWAALQRALALLRTERTRSIAEFQAELGATGATRLRSALRQRDNGRAAASSGALRDTTEPRPSQATPATAISAEAIEPRATVPDQPVLPRTGNAPRRTRRRVAIAALAAIVIGAAVVAYARGLLGGLDALVSTSRSAIAAALPRSVPPKVIPSADDRVRTDAAQASEPLPATPPVPTQSSARTEPQESAPLARVPLRSPSDSAAKNDSAARSDARSAAPAPSAPTTPRQVTETAAAPHDLATTAAQPLGATRAPFAFERSNVAVSESQSSVALTIRRFGNTAASASVVWWCRDGTATADEDFADLGERTETFAAGETSKKVFVPIVMDNRPEPTESFSAYLGVLDDDGSSVRVLDVALVEIDDDD
jgi:serine/threonine protein kinase